MKKYIKLLSVLLILHQCVQAQDPERARIVEHVENVSSLVIEREGSEKLLLFTGSSSIRKWEDIQDYFPGRLVINTGFGGSTMSDLLFYIDEVVLQYNPDQIFIYEGDNDVYRKKTTNQIMKDYRKVLRKINRSLPDSYISLISPKPSLMRWKLTPEYIELNRRLSGYAARKKNIDFIDLWPVMLNDEGTPKEDVFVEDGLHLNKKGYDLWTEEISKYIK